MSIRCYFTRYKENIQTRNHKHRRAAAKPAACAKPLMHAVNSREQGKEGGMVR